MKHFVILLCTVLYSLLILSCSDLASTGGDTGIVTSKSIIPLNTYNSTVYQVTLYDIDGTSILSTDTIKSEIRDCYILQNDTLELYPFNEYVHDSVPRIFTFGWMTKGSNSNSQQGLLLQHKNKKSTDSASIHIVGTFEDNNLNYWKDSSVLWLKYPAMKNTSWNLIFPDDSVISEFTVVQSDAVKFIEQEQTINCYLYKKVRGDRTSYLYYHPNYGLVASAEFVNEVRIRATHILLNESYIYR